MLSLQSVPDSDTGSESDFQTAPVDIASINKGDATIVTDDDEDDYDSDQSIDLLQPTQV